jgi:Ca2+/Na+ antiporter
MELTTFFVLFLLCYYTYYIFSVLTNKKQLKAEQYKYIELEKYRSMPVKTIEEQKKFLDLKFKKRSTKKKKFKITWKGVWGFIYTSIIYLIFFKFYEYWFIKYNIEFKLWQTVLFVIIFPLILNIILNKFNLSKSDINVFIRLNKNGGNKK